MVNSKLIHENVVVVVQYSNIIELPNSDNGYPLPLRKAKIIAIAIAVTAFLGWIVIIINIIF